MPVKLTFEILLCPTPKTWIDFALSNQETLYIDHTHCEKKAASTVLSMLFRYPEQQELCEKLSRIAREELRHFEQMLALLKQHNISMRHLPPGRYAEGLRKAIRTYEPARMIDQLIVSSLIEARSCERLALLAPHLPEPFGTYYAKLAKAEARHLTDYLNFAKQLATEDIQKRLALFQHIEAELILSADETFRFHSGIPN